MTHQHLIKLLGLTAHPVEGGYFAETYRAAGTIPQSALPGYGGARAQTTAIYYLLTPETFSALHRLPSDEIFHFYLGDPVEMLQLRPDGSAAWLTLGTDLLAGMRPQVVVPGGVWQGSRLRAGGRFALLGCTVSPGFDYADYETGDRDALIAQHPEQREAIVALTRTDAEPAPAGP